MNYPFIFSGWLTLEKQDTLYYFIFVRRRNAGRFHQVYTNAEHVFRKLSDLKEQWVDKIALGAIDLEIIICDHLKTAEDWDLNFRASKAWGQEIAKIIE
jgi:dynein heavy chain 2